MVVNASLMSQMRSVTTQTKSFQPKVDFPAVASVKVGDIAEQHDGVVYEEPKGFIEKIKSWLVEYRVKKIAEKAPEERTPSEQAEYEANQKTMTPAGIDYMV